MLLEITYGHKVQSSDDEHLRYVEQVDKIIQAVERGAIIDMIPVCERLIVQYLRMIFEVAL